MWGSGSWPGAGPWGMRPPMARPYRCWFAGVLTLAAVLTLPQRATAQSALPAPLRTNEGENETARSAAMGGALRAWGAGTTAMFLNPANLAETQAYHIEGVVQLLPEAARQAYGAVIMDSITNKLAGGVSVVGSFADPDGLDRTTLDVRVGLAYPLTDRFLVGITGRYVRATQLGAGPLGASKISGGLVNGEGRDPFVSVPTFDAGITVKVTEGLAISALGQNLTYPNNGVLPTTIGGGLAYSGSGFTIEADGIADLNSWGKPTARAMAGAEYVIAERFPIRAGYRYDQGADQHAISLGLGYITREFSVEASVRRAVDERGPTTVVLSLAYFLESSGLVKSTNELRNMQ
jgi:opacity protein-like surface antigen